MAEHFSHDKHVPGPDPVKVVNQGAWDKLPDYVQQTIRQFHSTDQLWPAVVNRIGHLQETERAAILRNMFSALSSTTQFIEFLPEQPIPPEGE